MWLKSVLAPPASDTNVHERDCEQDRVGGFERSQQCSFPQPFRLEREIMAIVLKIVLGIFIFDAIVVAYLWVTTREK